MQQSHLGRRYHRIRARASERWAGPGCTPRGSTESIAKIQAALAPASRLSTPAASMEWWHNEMLIGESLRVSRAIGLFVM